MLEMLNPTAADVLKFAGRTAAFRAHFALLRRLSAERSDALLVKQFSTPNTVSNCTTDITRLRIDALRFFNWTHTQWAERAPSVQSVIDDAEHQTVHVHGEALRCYHWRAKRGKPRARALLCHGFEGYALNFAQFISDARQNNIEVFAFDHAAHGASAGVKGGFRKSLDALLAIENILGPMDALIGHSLGAGALVYANANQRVHCKRMVLMAPFFDTFRLTELWAKAHLLDSAGLKQLQMALEQDAGLAFQALLPKQIARTLNTPTLILHDPKDRITRFRDSAELADLNSIVRLEACPQLGHVELLADPERMQSAVQFILEDV
jgi:pimeloyl-ACP methyl ester carboxylesterase